MLIKRIKFYQSVKTNTLIGAQKSEFSYIDSEADKYKIEYKNNLIYITVEKSGELTITGMNNVVYMCPYEAK